MKVALVIPVFDRINYLRQCLDSLAKLSRLPDVMIFVNDGSTDKDVQVLLQQFAEKLNIVKVITLPRNSGVQNALAKGLDDAVASGCDMLINLDSDAIVKPDFIDTLLLLHNAGNGKQIVSGFNTHHDYNPVINQFDTYCTKNYANGINMCFSSEQYYNYIKPTFGNSINWDRMASMMCQADDLQFIISTPSVVQHIGDVSSMGHDDIDYALDFTHLFLPDVTLFGINGRNGNIQRAAQISQKDIKFGAVNIIEDSSVSGYDTNDWPYAYSRFMMKNLAYQFDTSHVLTIQPDAYIVNWRKWEDDWLKWDYIGATWGYKDNKNVGNGGFSLRSKKLCSILSELNIPSNLMHPHDHHICRSYRNMLENDYGIRFATEEVANNFSIEAYGSSIFSGGNDYSGQFGFKGTKVNFSNSDIPANMLPI
ncbi:MAG: glycosyltransferase family 2 protein [Bacteroidetes bacterium]|nr:glycosyltransferase family 2 protein [Bacteroidota bacterium]